MPLQLRAATPADLPFRVKLHNALCPAEPTTLADLRRQDGSRRPDFVWQRWVAECGGQPVGQAVFTQQEWMFHPQKFLVNVQVLPAWQGRGVGRGLWARLEAGLREWKAEKLFAPVQEHQVRALRFLTERGFVQEQRERQAALQLADADLSGLAAALEQVRAQGYHLTTFAEYAAQGKELQLYTFDQDASKDVPRPNDEDFTFPTLERYWETIHANPNFDFSLWFVAVRNGELVGLSQLNGLSAQPEVLSTGFTAVARPHRRRGLALALKLTALGEARRRGYRLIKTENDSANAPMIAINDALGFTEQPAWLWLTRRASPP